MNKSKPKKGYKVVNIAFDRYEEIPEEWEMRKIGSLISEVSKKNKDDHPFEVFSITNTKGFVKSSDFFHKKVFSENLKTYKIVSKNEIGYNPSRINVGSVACFDSDQCGLVSPIYVLIKCKSELLPNYLLYFLKSSDGNKKIKNDIQASIRNSLSFKSLGRMNFLLPPKPQQEKILSILINLDNQIEKTNKIIKTIIFLKKGIMQKLFQKGISHKEFKKTKWYFGKDIEIPKKWDVGKFGDKLKTVSGSTPSRTNPEFFTGNILWVTSGDLNKGRIYDTFEKITDDAVKSKNLKFYPVNTFVLAAYGVESPGVRGNCGLLGKESTINQACMAFIKSNKIDSTYLFYFYQHYAERILSIFPQGSRQQNLYDYTVKDIKIIIPPYDEQKQITAILLNIDKQIQKEKIHKSDLEILKKGLLQKLLAGKIRVKV